MRAALSGIRNTVVSALPGTASKGDTAVLNTDGHLYCYDGTAWIDCSVVFGTQYQYASSEGTSSTTSSTFQTKVTLTTPSVPAGSYLIQAYAETSVALLNLVHEVQLVVDGVVQAYLSPSLSITGTTGSFSPMIVVALTAAAHTLTLQYRAVAGLSAVTIQRARITIWRVS